MSETTAIATTHNEVPPKILGALTHLASNGGAVTRTAGEVGISRQTISKYRRDFPELYASLTRKLAGQAEERLTDEYLAIASEAAHGARLATAATIDKLEADEIDKPWTTILPLTTAAAISTDKRRLMQERPTAITANVTTAAEDLTYLKSLAVESTATEIPQSNGDQAEESHDVSP